MPICRINERRVIFFDCYKQLSISPLGLFFGQTNPIQYTYNIHTIYIRALWKYVSLDRELDLMKR